MSHISFISHFGQVNFNMSSVIEIVFLTSRIKTIWLVILTIEHWTIWLIKLFYKNFKNYYQFFL